MVLPFGFWWNARTNWLCFSHTIFFFYSRCVRGARSAFSTVARANIVRLSFLQCDRFGVKHNTHSNTVNMLKLIRVSNAYVRFLCLLLLLLLFFYLYRYLLCVLAFILCLCFFVVVSHFNFSSVLCFNYLCVVCANSEQRSRSTWLWLISLTVCRVVVCARARAGFLGSRIFRSCVRSAKNHNL